MDKIPRREGTLVLGVDTHLDQHVAALLDSSGATSTPAPSRRTPQATATCSPGPRGHCAITVAGVEGPGSYGAGLARYPNEQGIEAVEVTRGSRRAHRHCGKSDPRDAEGAARAVLSGEAGASPKLREEIIKSIRVLRVTRSRAVKARTQAAIQLRTGLAVCV